MPRLPLLIISLLLCAFAVAACGGGDDDVDVDSVLRETFGEDKSIKSGRLDLNLRLDTKGLTSLQGPVSLRLAGPFASASAQELPRFDFEADLNAGGQSIRAGAVATGDKGFVTFQGQAYALSAELYDVLKKGYAEEAKKNEGDEEGVSFKSLGVDPQRWLRDPEYVGKEDTGGTETLRIRAAIDVPLLLEDVNKILSRAEDIQGDQGQPNQQARELTEAERKQVADAIKSARIEVWTGEEDKIMRRLNVRLDFEVPEANRRAANGLESGSLRFDLGLGAINEEQTFTAPEDAKPLEELIGAAGGAQPGAQPDAQPEGSAPAGTPYEQCVEEAGSDISKLQECAGLAGG